MTSENGRKRGKMHLKKLRRQSHSYNRRSGTPGVSNKNSSARYLAKDCHPRAMKLLLLFPFIPRPVKKVHLRETSLTTTRSASAPSTLLLLANAYRNWPTRKRIHEARPRRSFMPPRIPPPYPPFEVHLR